MFHALLLLIIIIVVVVIVTAMDNCADGQDPDEVERSAYFAGFAVYSPTTDESCLFAAISHQL